MSLSVIQGKALSLNNDWKKAEIDHGAGNRYFVFSMIPRNVTFGNVFFKQHCECYQLLMKYQFHWPSLI